MPAPQVRHVLFYQPLKPGNLILAEMEDRSLCILRDDQPLPGQLWPYGQMDEAVKSFMKKKRELIE